MTLGFIRYFATTDDSVIGRVALEYCKSLLRIAPVRVISKSGGLEGPWRKFEQLIMTPMAGACVSCVCTPPAQWIWEASVPMPAADLGAQGAAMAPSAPAIGGTAKGRIELYTPPGKSVLRNVLFVVDLPTTELQRQTALQYEAVVYSRMAHHPDLETIATNQDHAIGTILACVTIPVTNHGAIRNAVLGPSGPSDGVYR